MRVAVKIEYNRLGEIARRLPGAVKDVIGETLDDLETDVKTSMAGPKGGLIYGAHQASAPGEAPAVDTGNLIDSVQQTMVKADQGLLYTNAEYAEYLEFGTTRMANRPFFVPAAEKERREFVRKMTDLERRLR